MRVFLSYFIATSFYVLGPTYTKPLNTEANPPYPINY